MMVEVASKIGIVSKLAHCKSHLAALTKDGFDVVALGGSPTTIPPSIDVVVVRIESCSHGAHKVALNWSRKTGGRLITENGISGIRRALTKSPDETGYLKYRRAAEVLLRDRTTDDKSQVLETLLAMGADSLTADKVVSEVFAALPDPTKEDSVTLFPQPYPNPAECGWAALVSQERAHTQAKLGVKVLLSLPVEQRETIRSLYLAGMRSPTRYFPPAGSAEFQGKSWASFRDLNGRPHQFFVVLLLCLSAKEPHHRNSLQLAYHSFSGKRTDGRVANAAAWATGRILALERQPAVPSPTGEEPLVIQNPPVVEEDAELAPMKDFPATIQEVEAAADPVVMVTSSEQGVPFTVMAAEPQKTNYESSPGLEARMKALQNDLEGHLLDVMTQAADLKRDLLSLAQENATLREEVSGLRAQVEAHTKVQSTLREEVSDLRALVETTKALPGESEESNALLALGNLKESLDALRAKGVNVALKLKL